MTLLGLADDDVNGLLLVCGKRERQRLYESPCLSVVRGSLGLDANPIQVFLFQVSIKVVDGLKVHPFLSPAELPSARGLMEFLNRIEFGHQMEPVCKQLLLPCLLICL